MQAENIEDEGEAGAQEVNKEKKKKKKKRDKDGEGRKKEKKLKIKGELYQEEQPEGAIELDGAIDGGGGDDIDSIIA